MEEETEVSVVADVCDDCGNPIFYDANNEDGPPCDDEDLSTEHECEDEDEEEDIPPNAGSVN